MPLQHDLEENENVVFENAEDGSRIELKIRGRRLWVKAPQKYRVKFYLTSPGQRVQYPHERHEPMADHPPGTVPRGPFVSHHGG